MNSIKIRFYRALMKVLGHTPFYSPWVWAEDKYGQALDELIERTAAADQEIYDRWIALIESDREQKELLDYAWTTAIFPLKKKDDDDKEN